MLDVPLPPKYIYFYLIKILTWTPDYVYHSLVITTYSVYTRSSWDMYSRNVKKKWNNLMHRKNPILFFKNSDHAIIFDLVLFYISNYIINNCLLYFIIDGESRAVAWVTSVAMNNYLSLVTLFTSSCSYNLLSNMIIFSWSN